MDRNCVSWMMAILPLVAFFLMTLGCNKISNTRQEFLNHGHRIDHLTVMHNPVWQYDCGVSSTNNGVLSNIRWIIRISGSVAIHMSLYAHVKPYVVKNISTYDSPLMSGRTFRVWNLCNSSCILENSAWLSYYLKGTSCSTTFSSSMKSSYWE